MFMIDKDLQSKNKTTPLGPVCSSFSSRTLKGGFHHVSSSKLQPTCETLGHSMGWLLQATESQWGQFFPAPLPPKTKTLPIKIGHQAIVIFMVYWLISNLESISAFYPDFVHQEGASNACELLSDLDSFEVRGSKNGASLILFSPQGPKNRLILRHPCGGKVGTTPKVLGSFGTGTGGTASAGFRSSRNSRWGGLQL